MPVFITDGNRTVGGHSCLSPIVSLRIGLDCEAVTTVKATEHICHFPKFVAIRYFYFTTA